VFIEAYKRARSAGLLRALCNNRTIEATATLEIVRGSIGEREVVEEAMDGVTHVVHLVATVKETPDLVMDVTVKGMFQLLEASRLSPTFQQFMLIGGDAAMGHFFYKHPAPVTETQKWSAYPGCYALSKALEECMLEQYFVQYGLNGCCLMAPWIMGKDDFRYHTSFGDDLFGGPSWQDYRGVAADVAAAIAAAGAGSTVPLALDADGAALKRNFIHVDVLVECMLAALGNPVAMQQKYNVSMDEPVDYADMAAYVEASRGIPSIQCHTEFHSTWLDNSKAKVHLGWRPKYDMKALIDSAWEYYRSSDDPRVVYYPG